MKEEAKCPRINKHRKWACSSAGRAPALQAGGRRFDPGHVHQISLGACDVSGGAEKAEAAKLPGALCFSEVHHHFAAHAQQRTQPFVDIRAGRQQFGTNPLWNDPQ